MQGKTKGGNQHLLIRDFHQLCTITNINTSIEYRINQMLSLHFPFLPFKLNYVKHDEELSKIIDTLLTGYITKEFDRFPNIH